MGYIQNQFDKIIKHSIAFYAQELNVTKQNVQIQLCLHYDEAAYKICKDYKGQKEIKIIDLIHPGKKFKIDFTGRSQLVHPFIAKILFELAAENVIEPNKISVFCFIVTKDEKEKTLLYLYNGPNPVKRLNPATIFNDEKIVI